MHKEPMWHYMNDSNKRIKDAELDFLEDVQEIIIKSGGKFMRRQELLNMAVGDLLELLYNNGAELSARFCPLEEPNEG